MKRLLFPVLALVTAAPAQAPDTPHPLYRDPSQPAAARAHDLVSRMTLDEKASQLEDYAPAIPRLGIPDYQTWSEALHGVARSGYATVFPQAIGLAATWDTGLLHKVGDIISTEGRARFNKAQSEGNHRIFYGLTFWSPNINIFRDPRWGRGQETYGEDPFLTGRMGVNFIEGVQGNDPDHPRAVATSKHFAVHSGPESERHAFNVDVSPRDLEETYLPAFRTTVVDGHVKSIMCAYNAIDGKAACDNTMLLEGHLHGAWKFNGFVVSDCGAITDVFEGHHDAPDLMHASVISLQAGTDLSCGKGFRTLAQAVQQGLVQESLVTAAAERLFTARAELGLLDAPGTNALSNIPATEIASDAHRETARKAAEEAIVLLKNNGVLPLVKQPAHIAVIGPTAALLTALEGNYNGTPLRPVYPVDGITRQFGGSTIHYAQGSTLATGLAVPVSRTAFAGGLKAEYFSTPDWSGTPVATLTEPDIQHDWANAFPVPELHTHDYSVRWTGTIAPPAAGHYTLLVGNADNYPYAPKESFRLVIDDTEIATGDFRATPARIELDPDDATPHAFSFEYSHSGDRAGGGVTLKWLAPADAQLAEAVDAAKQSDVVIAFVGLSPQLEGEEMPVKMEGFSGGDRTSIDLPAAQQRLLEAVGNTGKPVIVVSLSGSAIALSGAQQHAAALLQAWYPGVEGGTAIARTLAGENNPAGRLPVTFYASTTDLPPFTDYSMHNRTYRYYTGKPLWGFGYGLSYSTFAYSPVKLSSRSLPAGQPVTATVTVTNKSSRAGDEVVEAYLKTPQPDGPRHTLVGFERVHLGPGGQREVAITVSPRSLSSVDARGERSILAGTYQLTLGSAQPEEAAAKSEASFTVTGTAAIPK